MVASATIRDIAIILVAIESIFAFLLLGIMAWQIWRLTKMVQTEIKPVLEDAQETLNTLKATTEFMSENMVQPVVKTSSQAIAARRTATVLMEGLLPKRKP